ncbi:hypothetical protein Tco_0787755 [Tanacetum coccineum]
MSARRQEMNSMEIEQIVAQRVANSIEAIAAYETTLRMTHDLMDKVPVAATIQRNPVAKQGVAVTCYESGNRGHVKSDCPKTKNQNRENIFGREKLARTPI